MKLNVSVEADELVKALTANGLEAGRLAPAQAKASAQDAAPKKGRKKMCDTPDEELPDGVKTLPKEAQVTFKSAFDTADENLEELEAYRAAWTEVKKTWRRVAGGWEQFDPAHKEFVFTDEPASVQGMHIADVDHLRRQLTVDGWEDVANLISAADTHDSILALQALPAGYRETITGRYLSAQTKTVKSVDEPFEIQVAFKALSPEKRVSYGVVYPVDEVDLQKEWAKADVIEKAAHEFLARYRQQDQFHNEQAGAGEPVESFIAPCDLPEFHGVVLEQPIRKGSWVMATRWSPEVWPMVKEGKISGYSIGGFKKVAKKE